MRKGEQRERTSGREDNKSRFNCKGGREAEEEEEEGVSEKVRECVCLMRCEEIREDQIWRMRWMAERRREEEEL